MPPVRQPSFSSGELAPALYGRVDLDQYGHGLKRLRNFFISRHGSAVSRPGTKFICRVKDDTKQVRLVLFRYADDESYCLEFGHNYVRFIFRGAQVVNAGAAAYSAVTTYAEGEIVTSGGITYRSIQSGNLNKTPVSQPLWWSAQSILEVPTTYTEAELFDLDIAQSGDILFIAHPSHPPRTLSRWSASRWTLAALDFSIPAWFGAASYRQLSTGTVDTDHPSVEWTYKVTSVGRTLTGMLVESLPVTITLDSVGGAVPAELAIYQDQPTELQFSGAAGTLPTGVLSWVGYRVYRGRGTMFGFVGEAKGAQVTTFKDYGQAPDEGIPPPTGRNPFQVLAADGVSVTRTEEPASVCFFEDRLVFGGTTERPGHIFASSAGSYLNFDERSPSTADEALEFELAARTREEIRRLVPRERLIVLTDASPWMVGGANGPLAATDLMDARPLAEIGAAKVVPLLARDSLLYARTKGTGVIHLARSETGYGVQDISALASHLFDKRSIVDWAYAEDPWSVVWAVRSDGRLLSLSFLGGGMAAWGWHDTGTAAGATQVSAPTHQFESVCAVPESTEDGVYLAVKRTVTSGTIRTIERMTDRLFTEESTLADCICLDAAYTYTGVAATVITGLTWLAGRTVHALADGVVRGPLTVSAAGEVTLPVAAVKAHIGLLYYPELETLNFADGRGHKKAVRKVLLEVYASAGLYAGSDFTHLSVWREGQDATALTTGLVEVPVRHGWGRDAAAALRQTVPLPVTVVSLIREMEVGGGA